MSNPESMDDHGGDLRRLYAAAPADEPPAALDAAILSRARAHAQSHTSAAATATRRRAWGPPMAMAAMVVLTASLVLVMQSEQPDVAGVAPPARDIALAPTPPGPPAEFPAQSPTQSMSESSSASARMERERRADARKVESAPPAADALAPGRAGSRRAEPAAPNPVARSRDSAPSAARAPDALQGPSAANVTPRSVPAAPVAPAPGASPVPFSAPSSDLRPDAPLGAASNSAEQQTGKAAAESRPRAFSAPAPAPQRPSASLAAPGRQAGGMGARDAAGAQSGVQSDAVRETAGADESPEIWLRRLSELRQQGRFREFEEGLEAFRKRHPGYRIPDALLAPTGATR